MYQVHNNIPVPADSRGRKSEYPFASMEVNHSFFVHIGERDPVRTNANVRAAASTWRRSDPANKDKRFKVLTMTHPVDGQPAIGVWRTN